MTRPTTNRQIAEEGADWATRLDAGPLDAGERKLLAKWLATSPVHVDELLFSASLLGALGSIDREGLIDTGRLLAAGGDDVVPLFPERAAGRAWRAGMAAGARRARQATPSGKLARNWPAIAAAIVLAVMLPLQLGPSDPQVAAPREAAQPASPQDYTTAVGEQRSIALDDGSLLYMNTDTRVRVSYSAGLRQIELLEGEGLFEVAHDPRRPFRVVAAGTITQAVGTKFNVRHSEDGVSVVVIEGKVLVKRSPPPARAETRPAAAGRGAQANERAVFLVAGQQANLGAAEAEPVLSHADLMATSAWRLRKLSFDDQPLGAIAAEFNRYNRTQLVVADPRLARTRISGVFDAGDPSSLIAFLELSSTVHVDSSEPGRIVLSRD